MNFDLQVQIIRFMVFAAVRLWVFQLLLDCCYPIKKLNVRKKYKDETVSDFLSWHLLAASRSASQYINMTWCIIFPRRSPLLSDRNRFGLKPFRKMFKVSVKKSKFFEVCCPIEMQIASHFFWFSWESIFLKFGTFGSLSNATSESYVKKDRHFIGEAHEIRASSTTFNWTFT